MSEIGSKGWGFPDGPAAEKSPASAGDSSLIPGLVREGPQALEQQNLCITTLEPVL